MPAFASQAVFLSYASQDAAAALRLAAELRAAGVEVWLDQEGGLVGGDAWDRKIREQIGLCALFTPIVSAATQARHEGYFRLEWKLAAQRTHLMSGVKAFLLPVVIDATRDAEAHVPDEFRAVQWTRLPGGEADAAFVARVRQLLGATVAGVADPGPASASSATTPASSKVGRRVPAIAGAIALLVVGAALFFTLQKPTLLTLAAPSLSDKSIAVLPFKNQSPDPENAFFTNGVHEDILTNLCNIRELRVISRTSVEQFRDTKKPLKQIGAELGVAFILEGSVQRVGDKVRVTGQLIDARTDTHLWAKAYDESLSNIFAIQAAIAKSIATELKTVLTPREKNLLEQRPTENLAAYDLYLKAGPNTGGSYETREALLRAAVTLDPKFALAWARLSLGHSLTYSNNVDRSAARLDKAKAAIDTAAKLAPDHPEVIHALGRYYYAGFRDYARSLEYFERVARLQPNNPDIWHSIAAAYRRQGRWTECVAAFRKGFQLDSEDLGNSVNLAFTLAYGRRYDEARAVFREMHARSTGAGSLQREFELAMVEFLATGATREVEVFFAGVGASEIESQTNMRRRNAWARRLNDPTRIMEFDDPTAQFEDLIGPAILLAARGDMTGVREKLPDIKKLRSRLESEPLNPRAWANVAVIEALLGRKEEAIRCAQKSIELNPESVDVYDGPSGSLSLAFVYAWTGDKDRAIAEYSRLLKLPGARLNIHVMKRAADYAPVRGDPRFEALLNDPKNNAPLF